ncbi:MAG: nucleoside hydrolase [Gemmatimonadota bacterium]
MSLPVIIDTDPGIDDCLAILLALASPEVDVRALTIVYGNTTLANATRNAREIARRARSDVAIHPGADRPLERPLEIAAETHGESGLGYAAVPAATRVTPNPLALLEALEHERRPVTLVSLGPLTNLALALRHDAALVRDRLAAHVAMAGNLRTAGNTTRYSEFNVWCDPEAAAEVHAAGLGTAWVGLDVTRRVVLDAHEVEALGSGEPEEHRSWLRDALRFYVDFHRHREGLDGCVVNDPLLIAGLIRPGIIRYADVPMRVRLADDDERGRTAMDATGPAARCAVDVDAAAALDLLRERVFS